MRLILFFLIFLSNSLMAEVMLPNLTFYPEKIEKKIATDKRIKVLIFLNKSCPCTQINIPYIEELKNEFQSVEFLGIHSIKTSSPEDIQEIITKYHPSFSIADDKDLLMANAFKANRTPQAFILDEKNNILYSGGITDRTDPKNATKFYLKKALTELRNHQPISENETRSLGCTIIR